MPRGTQPNLRRQRRLLLREIERSRAEKRMDENGTASTDYYGHGPLASSLLFSHTALAAWMASHNGTRPARATEGEAAAAGQPAGNNSKPHTACPNGPLCPLCPPGEFEVNPDGRYQTQHLYKRNHMGRARARGRVPSPIFYRGRTGGAAGRARDASHAQERANNLFM